MNLILLLSFLFSAGRWISYCNEYPGVFATYGPEKAMLLDPRDFGITYPLRIESLRTRFYSSMGGFTDSAFVYKIYAGDGQTLLFASETLIAIRPPTHFRYGLRTPVEVESGSFYISIASRTYNPPFAYPFIATDDNSSPQKSFYGSPGSWTLSAYGEFFTFVFVTWNPTAQTEKQEKDLIEKRRPWGKIRKIYNAQGELLPVDNVLPSGIYFLEIDGEGRRVEKMIKLK